MKEYPEVSETESEEEELFEHYRFKADPGQEMIRIDKFLLDRLPNTSRNKIQIAAKGGNVLVNEQKVRQNYRVKPGDIVSIVMPYPVRELELIPQNIPLDIVYEDETLIVVNKPANMVVHPGYGNYSGTLVNALVYHFENLPHRIQNYYGRPGLVHRIDKHTTGLLVVAKTEEALTDLARQFYERTTERRYQALVWGDVQSDGTIIGNLGRSLANRKVMTVFEDASMGKHAVTHYKVLRKFGLVTLLECKLETGRTHQIRVHMKYMGHPLFNDLEYGGNRILKGTKSASYQKFIDNCFQLTAGQVLHAKSIGFIHPETKEWMQFDSELPEGFAQVLKKWEAYTCEIE
jgi:23S rRNA pseudouridine1911/1915/1917 synthase